VFDDFHDMHRTMDRYMNRQFDSFFRDFDRLERNYFDDPPMVSYKEDVQPQTKKSNYSKFVSTETTIKDGKRITTTKIKVNEDGEIKETIREETED